MTINPTPARQAAEQIAQSQNLRSAVKEFEQIIHAAYEPERQRVRDAIVRAIEVFEGVGRLAGVKNAIRGSYGATHGACPVCRGENGNHTNICGIGEAITKLRDVLEGMGDK